MTLEERQEKIIELAGDMPVMVNVYLEGGTIRRWQNGIFVKNTFDRNGCDGVPLWADPEGAFPPHRTLGGVEGGD